MKLGLRPQLVADPRDLKMRTYMAALSLLPPVPPALNWAIPNYNYGQLANNYLGDCVPAAASHMIQNWTALVNESASPTVDQTIDVYCRACRYDRLDAGGGPGCFLTTVLQYWRETGVATGQDPVVYTGNLLSGAFQFHETVACTANKTMKAKVVGRDRQGRIVSAHPTFAFSGIYGPNTPPDGCTNDVQGDTVFITPSKVAATEVITATIPGVPVLSQRVVLSPFTAAIAALSPGALTVVNNIKPFSIGDIIVGNSSGARFQVTGVGPQPVFHKILAYVSLQLGWDQAAPIQAQAQLELKQAVQIFGGAFIAIALPNTAKNKMTWDVEGDPNDAASPAMRWSWGGHCVFVTGYDSQYVYFVTWGLTSIKMTWAFYYAYINQSFAIVSMDWISKASLLSASGFDLGTLLDDLAVVTA